jgi:hypothetical protein
MYRTYGERDHNAFREDQFDLRSRETGAELHSLTGATNDIHNTLGGSFVSTHCVTILFISPNDCSYVAI